MVGFSLFGGSGGASQKPKATKWLGMNQRAGKDNMFVGPEAATDVLAPLGDQQINLISIFGAARQGKSFLMNLLADQQDLFKISNLREPCTQGVDLSAHFLPLSKFSALNGCPAVTAKASQQMQIGFVDAEGQGDRDITYDSRLVSPVLLASKVVLFNWKDSLQADRMLNLLAVLARAAQGIELADSDGSKVFGHLHIVFRDWSFVDSTPEAVFNDLFQKEKGRSEEVNVRNLARANLRDAFESINIWLFPAPVANTANLKDKIRFDQLQRPFQDKLRELRQCLSRQLQEPMLFNNQPLTAKFLAQIMPALVETLNSDQIIMPESIYASMVRAETMATKAIYEKKIAACCEAAVVEDTMSTEEFEKGLRVDVESLVEEAYDAMKNAPSAVQKEMRLSLRGFAEKELQLALHANDKKIAERLSKEIDAVLENLKDECFAIEKTSIPMRSDLLSKKCSDLVDVLLRRITSLPLSSQGKRGLDAECSRIRQHASIMFEKLEVLNEKAIQRSTATIQDQVRTLKTKMTTEIHSNLDKKFSVKRPVTVATLQAELEDLYLRLVHELTKETGGTTSFISYDFRAELNDHKKHLAEEMNRRYLLEIRQILNEVGYAAREDLGKEVAFRLDGKMPLLEEEIKAEIDSAIQHVKITISEQLQGWTVLKSDIEAKSVEMEKLADVLTDEYLRRNHDLEKDIYARKEIEQYHELKLKLNNSFQREIKAKGFPTTDDEIDAVFFKILQSLAAQFLSVAPSNTSFTVKSLRESLTTDCRATVENQKVLNRLAIEKKHALELAEKERMMRERESVAAQSKEKQITELKSYVQKSLGEKDSESKKLRDELRAEVERARQLQRQMEEMRLKTAQIEAQKQEMELRAKERIRKEEQIRQDESEQLKKELEEMKIKAAEIELQKSELQLKVRHDAMRSEEERRLKQQIDEMKLQAAEMELQKKELELRALEEAERREEAENAARAAAAAAALSARAAIEAAANETTPVKEEAGRKRRLSGYKDQYEEDVDMESDSSPKSRRAPAKGSTLSGAERKKQRGPTKPHWSKKGPKMSLAEARKAAQEEVERRIQQRAQSLNASSKKK